MGVPGAPSSPTTQAQKQESLLAGREVGKGQQLDVGQLEEEATAGIKGLELEDSGQSSSPEEERLEEVVKEWDPIFCTSVKIQGKIEDI